MWWVQLFEKHIHSITHFLRAGIKSKNFFQISYENEDLATQGVRDGHVWGFITFPSNYSENMLDRFLSGNYAGNSTLEGSTVLFDLDLSSNIHDFDLLDRIFQSFKRFL